LILAANCKFEDAEVDNVNKDAVIVQHRTSIYLGSKCDRKLVAMAGEVHIFSRSAPTMRVMLSARRWAQFAAIHKQVDNAVKELICKKLPLAFCAHLGDGYYVSVKSDWDVDLSHFYVPYCHMYLYAHPTRSGISLCLDELVELVGLIPYIHDQHPDLVNVII